jgi:hypothetical protein
MTQVPTLASRQVPMPAPVLMLAEGFFPALMAAASFLVPMVALSPLLTLEFRLRPAAVMAFYSQVKVAMTAMQTMAMPVWAAKMRVAATAPYNEASKPAMMAIY